MFKGRYHVPWIICDTYTCILFLFYACVSTYTGLKILHHYHRDTNVFRKVIVSSCGETNSGFESENNRSTSTATNENGHNNENTIEEDGDKVSPDSSKNDKVEDIELKIKNGDTSLSLEESRNSHEDDVFSFPKRGSQFPIYRDEKKPKKQKLDKNVNELKVICGNRCMGSMPYQTRSSKFPDRSIVKVCTNKTIF